MNKFEQINQYVAGIRNRGKKLYARAYANHRMMPAFLPPEEKCFGISYMAAQAVRMNVETLLEQ